MDERLREYLDREAYLATLGVYDSVIATNGRLHGAVLAALGA